MKFKLPCTDLINRPTKDWLEVSRYLDKKDFNVLIGKLKTQGYKDVVIKFGEVAAIQKEYDFSLQAFQHNVPNFIKFICVFTCDDRIDEIKERNFTINAYICKGPGNQLGVIIMPYYRTGSFDSYHWNERNFDMLKSTLKQVVFAALYAYQQFQFVHRDFHLGNVLLCETKKQTVAYGDITLETKGIYAMIMDFGRSMRADNAQSIVYQDIRRAISLVFDIRNSDIVLHCDLDPLNTLARDNAPITEGTFRFLSDMIDSITVRYVKSKLPKINFLLSSPPRDTSQLY
jgi:hypothetical protein